MHIQAEKKFIFIRGTWANPWLCIECELRPMNNGNGQEWDRKPGWKLETLLIFLAKGISPPTFAVCKSLVDFQSLSHHLASLIRAMKSDRPRKVVHFIRLASSIGVQSFGASTVFLQPQGLPHFLAPLSQGLFSVDKARGLVVTLG